MENPLNTKGKSKRRIKDKDGLERVDKRRKSKRIWI